MASYAYSLEWQVERSFSDFMSVCVRERERERFRSGIDQTLLAVLNCWLNLLRWKAQNCTYEHRTSTHITSHTNSLMAKILRDNQSQNSNQMMRH